MSMSVKRRLAHLAVIMLGVVGVGNLVAPPASGQERLARELILSSQHTHILTGDTFADTVEYFPGRKDAHRIASRIMRKLRAGGWTPLRRNEATWRKRPTSRIILCYRKAYLFYKLFIFAVEDTKKPSVHVIHLVNSDFDEIDSAHWFLRPAPPPPSGK